jgi:hypothetical protein
MCFSSPILRRFININEFIVTCYVNVDVYNNQKVQVIRYLQNVFGKNLSQKIIR